MALKKKGLVIVSKCQFCKAEESLQHVFFHCPIVKQVWWFFASALNVKIRNGMNVRQVISTWLFSSRKRKHLTILLPPIILWAIWEARNTSKHKGWGVNHENIISRVSWFITKLGECNMLKDSFWSGIRHLQGTFNLDPVTPRPRMPKLIHWIAPPAGNFKLNIDGGSRGNPGQAAGGGVLRDSSGNWILAFRKYYGHQTAIYAEIRALVEGLTLCFRHKMANVIVNSDSKVIISPISKGKGPWHLMALIEQTITLMRGCKATLQHTYRECNSVADKLANLSMDDGTSEDYERGRQSMHEEVEILLAMDKQGFPYVRA